MRRRQRTQKFWSLCLGLMLALTIVPLSDSANAQSAGVLKPLLKGLISAGDQNCAQVNSENSIPCVPDNTFKDVLGEPGYISGVVINITWAQLQPTDSTTLTTIPIDNALAIIANYNATYPTTPLRATLRNSTGASAPLWAKHIDGGPAFIEYGRTGAPITVPLFWTVDYEAAWVALQTRLAALYDSNPLIAQVSNTTCAHQDQEPFSNWVGQSNFQALFALGYTNQGYLNCLLNSTHDYDAWTTTRVDDDFGQFTDLVMEDIRGVPTPVYEHDLPATVTVMNNFFAALGERGILANHNLNVPLADAEQPVVDQMMALGGNIQFQTVAPGLLADAVQSGALAHWNLTMYSGAKTGAVGIEIWPTLVKHQNAIQDGWNKDVCAIPTQCDGKSLQMLKEWNAELQANSGQTSVTQAASISP